MRETRHDSYFLTSAALCAQIFNDLIISSAGSPADIEDIFTWASTLLGETPRTFPPPLNEEKICTLHHRPNQFGTHLKSNTAY